jgi:hypothetical protein
MENHTSRLVLVWTTVVRETAMHMVLMYGLNAKRFGWLIRLIC